MGLKADVTGLRRYADELKSTDMTMLFGDDIRADDANAEFEVETHDKQPGFRDEVVYDDLADLEGAMIETAMHVSLRDTSMVGSSGAKDDLKLGTDSQIEKVADLQTSPRPSLAG
uniref:Polyprotein protein n=1 Tax=Solanum tuberosum TaxID=4113 RepID=M1E1D5_SOLTU